MANHTSTKKSIRKTAKRTLVNKMRKSRIRTFIKKVETAIANNEVAQAEELFKVTKSELHRGVTKGILHLNTASRKISSLSKKLKDAKAAA